MPKTRTIVVTHDRKLSRALIRPSPTIAREGLPCAGKSKGCPTTREEGVGSVLLPKANERLYLRFMGKNNCSLDRKMQDNGLRFDKKNGKVAEFQLVGTRAGCPFCLLFVLSKGGKSSASTYCHPL